MPLKIVTWNMNYAFRRRQHQVADAWAYLRSLDPDIALLQETARPPDSENAIWHEVWNDGWGTAVATRPTFRLTEIPSVPVGRKEAIPDGHLERSHPGAWVAADIQIPSVGLLTVVSVYGVMTKLRNGVTYATASVQRTLSDLTPVLDVHRSKARVVVAGDFNVSPQIGSPDMDTHVAIIDRIKAFGLVDCLRSTHDGYVRTHRHRNRKDGKAWQIDWVFSSRMLKLSSCEPMDVDEAWELSDHCPVVAEFEM